MSRPSSGAEKRLLEAGRALLPETGFSDLKVRDVARRAGVNLGLFHYHFKTKDRFLHRLLQENYDAFFARLSLESAKPGTWEEKLSGALTVFGRFVRDHRRWMMLLMREAMAGRGHPAIMAFAKDNVPRHTRVVAGLISQGQKKGELRRMPLPAALNFAMGAVAVPSSMLEMIRHARVQRPFSMSPAAIETAMVSDAAIDLRVEMVLAGLRAPGAYNKGGKTR